MEKIVHLFKTFKTIFYFIFLSKRKYFFDQSKFRNV
jgi:hypothetical protein